MPSVSRKQHKLMEIAAHTPGGYGGVPQKVGKDFAAADKSAGKFKPKRNSTMKKHGDGGMMESGDGMSPRKAMASGKGGEGNFGVQSYEEEHGGMGTHPDAKAGTGAKGAMEDHERGIGHPIHHTKGHLPAQAAPGHGPHHVEGYGDHHGREQHPEHRHETKSHKERMKDGV
jgi:hypothetical protein